MGKTEVHPAIEPADLPTILHALSDPMRLEMVRQLACCGDAGEMSCGQISLPISKSTASHHFKLLLEAGVVGERGEGTRKYLHLRRDAVEARYPGLLDSVLNAIATPAR